MSPARPVYSTGPRGARSSRGETGKKRPAEPVRDLAPERHAVRIRLERTGRKGKQVTVAGPFLLVRDKVLDLLKQLRKLCGTGGTLKPSTSRTGDPAFELELQGDHADRLLIELAARGFPAKRSGG